MALLEVDYINTSRDSQGKVFDCAIYLTGALPGGATDPTGVEIAVAALNGDGDEGIRDKVRDAVIGLLQGAYGFSGLVRADVIVDDQVDK